MQHMQRCECSSVFDRARVIVVPCNEEGLLNRSSRLRRCLSTLSDCQQNVDLGFTMVALTASVYAGRLPARSSFSRRALQAPVLHSLYCTVLPTKRLLSAAQEHRRES
jgi:hypothetical protein